MKKLVCLAIARDGAGSCACAPAPNSSSSARLIWSARGASGGGADSPAPVGPRCSRISGRLRIEVVNVEGGSGVNGVEYTHKQLTDGYTFMLGTQSLYIQDMLATPMDFKTEFECEDVLVHSINAIVASKISLE